MWLVATPGRCFKTHLFDLAIVVLWALPIITVPRGLHFLRLLLSLWLAFFASGVQHGREILDDRRSRHR
jgi:hypothetical protein